MSEFQCQRNLILLYFFTVCVNAVFILPVMAAYYQADLGLSFHDLLIGESVFAAGVILFDVPTGWAADQWGRKRTMMCGAATYIIGLLVLMFAGGLISALLAQAILALAISFISGANSALLYDTLLSQGREDEFRKREGFRFGLQLYTCAIACVTGGYMYQINHAIPFVAEIVTLVIGVILAFLITEPPRHKRIVEHHPVRDMLETMHYVLRGHREIAAIILLMLLVFPTTKLCMWTLQAYSQALHLPESANGWIVASAMLLGAVSGHFNHKIFPNLNGRQVLYLLIGILIIMLVASGLFMSPLGLVLLGLEGFVYGFGAPRIQETINNLADSGRRATILSTANLATSIGFIPYSQVFGWVNDNNGLGAALITHAALLLGLSILLIIPRLFCRNR